MSAVISIVTAFLLFLAVRRFLVKPIKGVVDAMISYAEAPEDARRIIVPSAGVSELREAENALQSMQTQLTGSLRQKERLAQLGEAVAKVSHDLRNILTTAQLFTDRMEQSADPAVKRVAPKLINSISRAVNLCESTLAFGKAEEPPPALSRVSIAKLVNDVIESERLAAGDYDISYAEDVPSGMMIRADAEQIHRVLSNLVRNARQAIINAGKPGEIAIRASETEGDWISNRHRYRPRTSRQGAGTSVSAVPGRRQQGRSRSWPGDCRRTGARAWRPAGSCAYGSGRYGVRNSAAQGHRRSG